MSYIERISQFYQEGRLCAEEIAYYARHLLLPNMGTSGQLKLKAARVLVVGAGGLGCPALQAFAGAGVGQLTVIDGDSVALSNVSRQWLHRVEDSGRNKAESAVEKLQALNPYIKVEAVSEMLNESNASRLIEAHDIVVDATDDLDVRYLIDSICAEHDCPWVHAALYRANAQLTVFWDKCGARFNQLFAERSEAPSCAGAGMLGAVASVTANLQAIEVIKLITGNGVPQIGEVVSINAEQLQLYRFRLPHVVPAKAYPDPQLASHAMSAEALRQAQSIGEAVAIFDLRSTESSQSAIIPDATRITAEAILETGLPDCGRRKRLLVCEEGVVSGLLADALRSQGADHVFHLDGGYRE